MSRLITFEEGLRKGYIRHGDLINPDELFIKNETEIVLTKEETGFDETQKFSRENLTWFFSTDRRSRPTIYGSTTTSSLCLKGKAGYENAVKLQNRICDLYSNAELGIEARITTPEDMGVLNERRSTYGRLKENKLRAWLGKAYKYPKDNSMTYGVRFMDGGDVYYCDLFVEEKNQNKSLVKAYGICPALNIQPSEIFIDLNSKGECGYWRLIKQK